MSVSVESIVDRTGVRVITFVDHLGNRYSETMIPPAGWTQAQIDAHAAIRAADLAERLAEAEAQQVVS